MQAEHQHAILGFGLIQRLRERDAATAGLELVLERPRVTEQLLRLHLVDGVGHVPEPQIGLGQSLVQRLRARHRDEPLLVGAAEQNGGSHQPCFSLSSFRDGPNDQTRNLSSR